MTVQTVHVCEHCGKNAFQLAQENAGIYTPMRRGQHATCAPCMRKGERAGLVYDRIMIMNRAAFERALKSHELEQEKAAEHKVIHFDPKKKLPKPSE